MICKSFNGFSHSDVNLPRVDVLVYYSSCCSNRFGDQDLRKECLARRRNMYSVTYELLTFHLSISNGCLIVVKKTALYLIT